jgi:hypothetical protein
MARDDLTVEMEARGGRETRREIDKTGRSARNFGKDVRNAKDDTNLFSRALRLLGTRMGMIIIVGALMTVTLGPPMLAALALLTAAIVTLGGVALGVFGVGAAVALRWQETVKSAGSAAWELKKSFDGIKTAFAKATATGADKVLRAVADAVQLLAPVALKLAPALNALADSIAFGITIAAHDLVDLIPQMNGLFAAAGPLIEQLAGGVGPLARALLALGTAGIPVLQVLIGWLIDFISWLGPAIEKAIAWEQDTHTLWNTLQIFGGVVSNVAGFIADLGKIIYALGEQTAPFWEFIGSAALAGLSGVADGVESVSNNMDIWGPIITATAGSLTVLWGAVKAYTILSKMLAVVKLAQGIYIGWRAGVLGVTLAQLGLNLQLMITLGIVGLVILVIAALAFGIYEAYQHFGWFRDAVNWVWQALKDVWGWAKANWPLLLEVLTNPFSAAADLITASFDTIKNAIRWVVDQVKWLLGKLGPVTDAVGGAVHAAGKIKGPSGIDLIKKAFADGGTASSAGSYLVGERGPEVVHLRRGAVVQPNDQLAAAGGDVHVTVMMPNGDVLARSTLRAALRKRSLS